MARLVTKFKYLKHAGRYAKYIATREGVEKLDDSKKYLPATEKQKTLVQKILKEFPDSKRSLEYEDYLRAQTQGAASEFIARSLEENAAELLHRSAYADYRCENVQLIPGRSYHKMPYVKNTGKNDAYIRIRVMIPADLDTAVLNSSMYTSSAMDKGEFTMAVDQTGTADRDGLKYNVYTFTRIDPLAPGEMTYWNVWGTIHMDTTVTTAQSEALFGENGSYSNGVFPVLVEADAIQAEGFADAAAAWAAFN